MYIFFVKKKISMTFWKVYPIEIAWKTIRKQSLFRWNWLRATEGLEKIKILTFVHSKRTAIIHRTKIKFTFIRLVDFLRNCWWWFSSISNIKKIAPRNQQKKYNQSFFCKFEDKMHRFVVCILYWVNVYVIRNQWNIWWLCICLVFF